MVLNNPLPSKGIPALFSSGHQLDPDHVGLLRSSLDILDDTEALRRRVASDGYLYLPGLLNRDEVLAARAEVVKRLSDAGYLKPGADPMQAIINPKVGSNNFQPDLAKNNAALNKVLYNGPMMAFYERFLGGAVRHFDFTWLRSVGPGNGTPSHCDIVYMGRGTTNLYTAWAPLGDVDFTLGGLMILAESNKNNRLKSTYGKQDVDSFCNNKPGAKSWGKSWGTGGYLHATPNRIRNAVAGPNGRWLTAEFRAGDVLTFTMYTVHASLDNRTKDRIRFSSDSRYQLASDPVDERWVGENPIGHSEAGKRGKVC